MYKKKYPKKKEYKTEFIYNGEKFLIIVESPSKCKKIESYLGPDYKCVATCGHLSRLKSYKDFNPIYEHARDKSNHIRELKSFVTHFEKENIYLATDLDREGETIAYFCYLYLMSDYEIDHVKRIVFNEITKDALRKAVENPLRINMKLVNSQQARQMLDVIIGYKISPLLWKYAYHSKDNTLSAGRCQTPALRLIYDNYIRIKGEKMEKTFKTIGNFIDMDFALNKNFDSYEQTENFIDKSRDFHHKTTISHPKKSERSQPKPYNTAKLLQEVTHLMNLSPKGVMDLCQILYQDGHITYMRTESKKYSLDFIEKARNYVISQYGDKFIGNLHDLENTNSKDPHEAIRVTNLKTIKVEKDPKLNRLYQIIWSNTVESVMCPAVYELVQCKISAPDDYYYSQTIETPIFYGWQAVKQTMKVDVDIQSKNKTLLMCLRNIEKKDTILTPKYVICEETMSKKTTHYTESALVKKLEELEIGRPSTYATFLETLLQRGYICKEDVNEIQYNALCLKYLSKDNQIEKCEKSKKIAKEHNKLIIQPIGILIIEFLIKYFDEFFSYTYTKQMEEELDRILTGEIDDWKAVCKKCNDLIKHHSEPLKTMEKEIFYIDTNHNLIFTQNGPVLKQTHEDGTIQFKGIKKEISLSIEKLRNSEYKLDELLETSDRFMGTYQGENLHLKLGKYGLYAEWGEKKKSLSSVTKTIDEFTFDELVKIIEQVDSNMNILRVFNPFLSIRRGKFGPYVYYKRPNMRKPEFLTLKNFKEGFTTCDENVFYDWLEKNHNISVK